MRIAPADTCIPNNLQMRGPGLTNKSKQPGLAFAGNAWTTRSFKTLNTVCPSTTLPDMGMCKTMKTCGEL